MLPKLTKEGTVERSNIILLNFLLEKELPDHKSAFGYFSNSLNINILPLLLKLLLVSNIAMHFILSSTSNIRLPGLPNTDIHLNPPDDLGKHDKDVNNYDYDCDSYLRLNYLNVRTQQQSQLPEQSFQPFL